MILEQGLLSWLDSDGGIPAVPSSWQTCALMVHGLFLNIPTSFLLSKDDGLGLLPDFGKVVTHPNNLHLHTWLQETFPSCVNI